MVSLFVYMMASTLNKRIYKERRKRPKKGEFILNEYDKYFQSENKSYCLIFFALALCALALHAFAVVYNQNPVSTKNNAIHGFWLTTSFD